MIFKTIEDLYKAVSDGRVDESKLDIMLDSDYTGVYIGEEVIFEGNGYRDIEDLYPLLFPKSFVNWC